MAGEAGKGDTYRKVHGPTYRDNWDDIFGKAMSHKTLIISDIHHQTTRADAIIKYVEADKVILLGDYQDHFHDTAEDARRTALWLKDSLTHENRVHLTGNHCLSYMYPRNSHAYCSGFEHLKSKAIDEVMTRADWDKLKLFHIEHGILFSHAGLSTRLLNQMKAPKTLDKLLPWLEAQGSVVHALLADGKGHDLIEAGYSRGGRRPVGGITWADHDLDGMPMETCQIVGHSPHPKCDFLVRDPNSPSQHHHIADEMDPAFLLTHWWSLDLDTHLNHYATIEVGVLRIFEISWAHGEGISRTDEIGYVIERFEGKLP